MMLRNVIVGVLLPVLVVLTMSIGVQAQEFREEVPASDILEQIKNGEDIYLENVRITGELDLSKIELKTVPIARTWWQIEEFGLEEEFKIVKSKITITNSVFENDVDFSNTQFRKPLDFSDTEFSCKTDFRGVHFSERVDFVKTSFSDYADFRGANFSGHAEFRDANFSGHAEFRGANFSGYADFRGAIFSSYADFWNASFSDYADFGGVGFNGWAEFSGANFSGDTDFGGANFIIGAIFSGVSFSSNAFFNFTKFNRVFLSNTKFTKVSLIEADFKSMKVSWSSLENALVFDGPTYIKLIKNFREMEQFDDADDAYFQYRRLSQANKGVSFSKLGDIFMWVTCGYGVEPHYTIICGLVIILVFAIIYWLGGGIRRLKEKEGDDNRVSFLDAFYFSMVTFTTVGFGDWYPVDRYRMAVMIEGLVGWLTLALFLVTLANVMIRP